MPWPLRGMVMAAVARPRASKPYSTARHCIRGWRVAAACRVCRANTSGSRQAAPRPVAGVRPCPPNLPRPVGRIVAEAPILVRWHGLPREPTGARGGGAARAGGAAGVPFFFLSSRRLPAVPSPATPEPASRPPVGHATANPHPRASAPRSIVPGGSFWTANEYITSLDLPHGRCRCGCGQGFLGRRKRRIGGTRGSWPRPVAGPPHQPATRTSRARGPGRPFDAPTGAARAEDSFRGRVWSCRKHASLERPPSGSQCA